MLVADASYNVDNPQDFALWATRMSEVTAIQFTQEQARTLTGVSVETIRHWRKAIPYLSSKTGKAARFTFADVLGLAVTHELVDSFGVHIASLSAGVDAFFRLLASSGPASLEGAIVFITSTEATLAPQRYNKCWRPWVISRMDSLRQVCIWARTRADFSQIIRVLFCVMYVVRV